MNFKQIFNIKSIFAFIVISTLSVSLINSQFELMTKRQELDALEKQETRLIMENKDASRLLNSETDEEYIERIARERLGYGSPDEKVFMDIQGE